MIDRVAPKQAAQHQPRADPRQARHHQALVCREIRRLSRGENPRLPENIDTGLLGAVIADLELNHRSSALHQILRR